MAVVVKDKNKIVESHRVHGKDTGSPEVQVAIFTKRIDVLTEHLKLHPKDFASRRGLLMLVGKRSSLLQYLKKRQKERYQKLITTLGLRK